MPTTCILSIGGSEKEQPSACLNILPQNIHMHIVSRSSNAFTLCDHVFLTSKYVHRLPM